MRPVWVSTKPSPQQLSTRDLGVGALPICGDDDRLPNDRDRDIVIKCAAAGKIPHDTTGELAQGSAYHVSGDADIKRCSRHGRTPGARLPVIEDHRVVGIVSEADIARNLPEQEIAQFVKAICSPKALTSH